jgi:tetratricopeptide (TPR) repeat protein
LITMTRKDLIVMMEAGYIYLGHKDFKAAKEVFEGVAQLSPNNEIPIVAIGNVYFGQLKYNQAIKMYQQALKLTPDSPFAHAYLGESLFFKGKKEEGVKELEKASQLDPKGQSGDFARTLLEAIKNGFEPPKINS